MAQATDTVWLPVLPSMKGFGPALVKQGGASAAAGGKTLGATMGKAMVVGVAAAAAGIAAVSTVLYNTGKTFDDVNNTIRVGTGASGKALDELNDVAKNVGRNVPAEWDKIATTVADLNTRLGLSGDTLDKVASQYLEAGRILGEDVDIEKTSKAFTAFGIEGDAVSGSMDHLFRVSQATGIGMNDLAEKARQASPAADALGLSFEETTAMVGNLDKAGLDSGKMLQAMSRRMGDVAKDGEKPRETFNRVTAEMGSMIAAGDHMGAQKLGEKAFGTKNAEQFIKALGDGTLNMDDLGEVAGMTSDTILEAGQETMQFGEQWQLFKNNVMVWLEPLATRVFGAINDLLETAVQGVKDFGAAFEGGDVEGKMGRLGAKAREVFDYMRDTALPALQDIGERVMDMVVPAVKGFVEGLKDFGGWISDNRKTIGGFASVIGGMAAAFLLYRGAVMGVTAIKGAYTAAVALAAGAQRGLNAAMRANPIGVIITLIGGLVAGLTWFFTQTETGQKIWDTVWGAIKDTTASVVGWFQDTALPALQSVWDGIMTGLNWLNDNVIQPVWEGIKSGFDAVVSSISWAWESVLKPVWDGIAAAATWLWESVLQPVFGFIVSGWEKLSTAFSWYWEGILKPVFELFGAIISWLWENVAKPYFQRIQEGWQKLSDALVSAWENHIWPMIESFGDFIVRLYQNYVKPALDWIVDAWNWVKDTIVSLWENHIKPAYIAQGEFALKLYNDYIKPAIDWIAEKWGWVKDAIVRLWEKHIKPAYRAQGEFALKLYNDYIKPALDWISEKWEWLTGKIGDTWETIKGHLSDFGSYVKNDVPQMVRDGVDAIDRAWRKVANFFRKPINSVIDFVWNDGIADMFNAVAKAVGIYPETKMATIPRIPAFADGGVMQKGWKLVGEEGPELINTGPGYVHTAAETSRMLKGDVPEGEHVHPMGGAWSWVKDKVASAFSWVRGALASTAERFIKPFTDGISGYISEFGPMGELGGGLINWGVDEVLDWIRGEDTVESAGGHEYDGPMQMGGAYRPGRGPITSWYGMRGGRLHGGVDIAGPRGAPTFAAWDGVVHSIQNYAQGSGLSVNLSHGGGKYSHYGHNDYGGIPVRAGQSVKAGQRIGNMGMTGRTTGPHVHFETWQGGLWNRRNPNALFRDGGGPIYPGMNMVLNKTPHLERTFNDPQFQNLNRMAELAVNGGGAGGRDIAVTFNGVDMDQSYKLAQDFRRTTRQLERVGY